MPFRFPVSLEVGGRRCVVVGGGEVAEHRARALLSAGARVVAVAPAFTTGLEELACRGELELLRRAYSRGDLAAAFLAIAATGDAAVNAEVLREAEAERVLLNAVDDPAHCHFAIPSVVRRGDLTITVSTGGKAPALSKRLRRRLGREFGAEWGALVELLAGARAKAIARREVGFAEWAARWQEALGHDLAGLVREGRDDEARELVRRSLEGERSPPSGRVDIVGAGPGDPELVTVRGRRLLDEAEVVVHDRLVHPALLDVARESGAELIDAGKRPGRHALPQEEINTLLVRLAREGRRVVRLKGGDPFVFGRGAEEAGELAAAGVPFSVVPAPTSAVAVPAAAGIPVTDRRCASSVVVVTGHCASREVDWGRVGTAADTIVVLMGMSRIEAIVAGLVSGGLDPARPAACVQDGTLPAQRVVTSPLADLPAAVREAGLRAPAVLVVGEVVRLREALTAAAAALS